MIALGTNVHIFARPHRRDELTWALPVLAPYAMIFGLVSSPVSLNNAQDTGDARPRETEAPWSQSDRFASD
jgi:hypothetical protein